MKKDEGGGGVGEGGGVVIGTHELPSHQYPDEHDEDEGGGVGVGVGVGDGGGVEEVTHAVPFQYWSEGQLE